MGDQSLGRIAGNFLASGLLVQSSASSTLPAADALRNQFLGLLDQFSKHPDAARCPPDEVELARFALVAWLDEVVGSAEWPGSEQWNSELLQLQLYRTNRAGNEFYERLAAMRPDQNDAREIYFLCLALGFQGQYAGHEGDRQAILRQQYEMLRAAGRARDSAALAPLAPSAYEVDIELEPRKRRGLLTLVLGWSGIAAVTFGALWGALYWMAQGVPLPPGM